MRRVLAEAQRVQGLVQDDDLGRTGRKEPWKELAPPDRAGVVWMQPLVTGDGRSYVYTYHRLLSDLYLVLGLK